MPALWQSSQRPMYVRTVWVGGFRHAILTQDDPYLVNERKKRPYSSASCKPTQKAQNTRNIHSSRPARSEDLEGCFRQLNYISDNSILCKKKVEIDIEKLNLRDLDQESEDDFFIKANPQPLYEFESCRSKFNNLCLNMKTLRSNRCNKPEIKENTELSDRVLQWLDLAGKIDLLAPENTERMSQQRHSWPEIQRKNHNLTKSKTTIDIRSKQDTGKVYTMHDSAKGPQWIDRSDSYAPSTANTIENYARQTRNVKLTPRVEISTKIKENSPKLKDGRSKDIKVNIMEARQKVATERNAVEKQYAELVSKKLIPDLSKSSKKQVHIFMPDMPKKQNSNVSSRTESLLTTKT